MAPHFGKRGVSDKNPDGGFSNGKRKMQRRRLKRVNQKLGDKLFHGFEPRGLRLSQTLHELPRSRKKIPSHKRHRFVSSLKCFLSVTSLRLAVGCVALRNMNEQNENAQSFVLVDFSNLKISLFSYFPFHIATST